MEEIAHNKFHCLNEFAMKILAIVLMTIDHVGIFLILYNITDVGTVLRDIGRLAFPLFILMLVEGVRHTRNYPKYVLRLGIIATAIALVEAIIYYFIDSGISIAYSPFIDLVVLSLILYLIKRKDKFTWLIILPIMFIGLSFAVQIYENLYNSTVLWFPFYLRPGYCLYGLLLAVGFWFAFPLSKKIMSISSNTNSLVGTSYHRTCLNATLSAILFLVIIAIYLLELIPGARIYSDGYTSVTWSLLAIPFILIYNGKRGYNKPWFKYGCYLYYPLHIAIIFAIFSLIFM